jgi:hypothetical protein
VLSSRMSLTQLPGASTPLSPDRRPLPLPCLPAVAGRSLGVERSARTPTPSGRRAHFSVFSVPSVVNAFSVLFLRASPASLRLPAARQASALSLPPALRPAPFSPRRARPSSRRRLATAGQLQHNLPLQLQLHAFLRSVDYGGLMWHLSPCRINTSKNSCTFCISLITRDLKSPIINTSMKNALNSSGINTSKKQAGGWLCSGKSPRASSPHVRRLGPARPLLSAPPLPFRAAWSR